MYIETNSSNNGNGVFVNFNEKILVKKERGLSITLDFPQEVIYQGVAFEFNFLQFKW